MDKLTLQKDWQRAALSSSVLCLNKCVLWLGLCDSTG